MHDDQPHRGRPLRVGSLFSGYGGLDLWRATGDPGSTMRTVPDCVSTYFGPSLADLSVLGIGPSLRDCPIERSWIYGGERQQTIWSEVLCRDCGFIRRAKPNG